MLPPGAAPFTLRCVRCGAALGAADDTHRACTGCGKRYPLLAPGLPLLVEDSEEHSAAAVAELLGQVEYIDYVISHLEGQLAAGSRRPQALHRILDMMRASAVLLRKLLGMLPHLWTIEQLTKPRAFSTKLDLQYLVRDWGGRPQAEATVAQVLAAVRRQLELAHTGQRDTALVLGAGTGRFAWELTADFTDVLALDWSTASALSYALLAQGPIDLHERNDQNVATVEDLAVPVRCELPPRGAPPDPARRARLHWVIADGRRVPLAEASCSAVLSIYYTDLVPPDALIEEAWRLLRPGGVFVHFGSIGYERGAYEEMPTAEELQALFAARGFTVTPCEWAPHLFWPSQRLVQMHMNAFSFAAVKPATL